MTDATNADELRADLEQIADDRGEIDDDRPTLTVTYETRQGTERTRTGDVWRVSDGGTFDDAVIRFSANIGGDEDAYYLRVRGGDMTLVSISERGNETDLGEVASVETDGINTEPELVADGGRPRASGTDERHELRLYDVTGDGDLAVDYKRTAHYHSAVAADHTHARLPFECVGLFGDNGRVEVGELSDEERAWVEAESDALDLSGVPA